MTILTITKTKTFSDGAECGVAINVGLRPSLLTLGRIDASIILLSLNLSLGLRPSLLTLGRIDASIILLSLNLSLHRST